MKPVSYAPVTVLASLLVAGCVPFPVRWEDTPLARGEVIDAVSAKPVAGAMVTINAADSSRSASTKTDGSGRFELAAITHWRVIPIPMDPIPPGPPTLVVTAPGYQPFQQKDRAVSRMTIRLIPEQTTISP